MGEMKKITKEAVDLARSREPKRICFATTHTTALLKYNNPKATVAGRFKVPFGGGLDRLFPWDLYPDKNRAGSCWRYTKSKDEFGAIKEWMERQGRRVFLRDCLYASIALSLNFEENTEDTKTAIGKLEEQAKYHQGMDAVKALAGHCINTIKDFPLYDKADFVCAMPSQNKDYDLPTAIVSIVSEATQKPDITKCFSFGAEKKSARAASIDEKWDIWENAKLTFNGDLTGKTIILIDDKYQSGITIQYVAMILQKAGAGRVLGLCMVKTRSNTDNQ